MAHTIKDAIRELIGQDQHKVVRMRKALDELNRMYRVKHIRIVVYGRSELLDVPVEHVIYKED